MLRIFILLLILIIVPPIYLDRTFMRRRKRRLLRLLLFLPNALMLVAAVILALFETYTPDNANATNLFLTLFTGYIVSEALLTVFLAIGHRFKQHSAWRKTLYTLGIIACVGNIYILIVGTTYGKYHIETKKQTITFPDLPQAFDGYRIVQLADLHIGSYRDNPQFIRHIVELVKAQKPDLIVFTGDLVNYNADELDPLLTELKQLEAPDGVISIMGNHDYMPYIKWATKKEQWDNIRKLQRNERNMGWNLLLNEHVFLKRANDSIAVIGVENDGNPPFPQRADLKKAQKGIPVGTNGKPFFKILLTHDPSHWRRNVLPETNIQLTLSGHTHGGQLKLFGFITPIALITSEWGGLYSEGQRKLYVSTGLGEALFTFRYGMWPQIDVITLQKGAS